MVHNSKESHEQEFWLYFFLLAAPTHVKEFKRRLNSNHGKKGCYINYDFWAGSKSYLTALKKAVQTVDSYGEWWRDRERENLTTVARTVARLRKSQLNPKSASYNNHVVVYNLWVELVQSLESSPKFKAIPEFVVLPGVVSSEYKFWVFFLGVHCPWKKEEFLRITGALNCGVIDWEFWTEDPLRNSYFDALDSLFETVQDKTNDQRWTAENWNRLLKMTDSVVSDWMYLYGKDIRLEFEKVLEMWEKIRRTICRPLEVKKTSSIDDFFILLYRLAWNICKILLAVWAALIILSSILNMSCVNEERLPTLTSRISSAE